MQKLPGRAPRIAASMVLVSGVVALCGDGVESALGDRFPGAHDLVQQTLNLRGKLKPLARIL